MSVPLTLTCPQCAAPLPRVARWRTVNCSYCGATVSPGTKTVERATFFDAWTRAQATPSPSHSDGKAIQWLGNRYTVLATLGKGQHSDMLLTERSSGLPCRVVLKLAAAEGRCAILRREADTLASLQAIDASGSAYYSQRLPQPLGVGSAQQPGQPDRDALGLRHPPGYWGSLAEVALQHGSGIDPRHAVWMWRRMLEVLSFVHGNGWAHGDLQPAHALVHPRDHGVLLIGWSHARRFSPTERGGATGRDLAQTAWTIRALLHGQGAGEPGVGKQTPAPLSALLRQCSEDAQYAARLSAEGVERALSAASQAAFGPAQFLHFDPAPQRG